MRLLLLPICAFLLAIVTPQTVTAQAPSVTLLGAAYVGNNTIEVSAGWANGPYPPPPNKPIPLTVRLWTAGGAIISSSTMYPSVATGQDVWPFPPNVVAPDTPYWLTITMYAADGSVLATATELWWTPDY